MSLPPPNIVTCYLDIGFIPPLASMHLAWEDTSSREWTLPNGESLIGPPPTRFGLRIRRQAENAYAVTLMWDSTYRQWFSLRREELLKSALVAILEAMGTPLPSVLDQPQSPPPGPERLTSAA